MSEQIKIYLKQGIGVPPSAVVQVGDNVRRGQLIAKADPEKLSVDLHSSVQGTVEEVTPDYISISADDVQDFSDYVKLDTTLPIKDIVRNAGIVGMGGAGFPSYVKMGTALTKEGYIICNAAECEPVLEHNMHQIRENPKGLLEAMTLAMESTGAGKGIIGIKLKHRAEIKLLTQAIKEFGFSHIRVLPLRNVYPVGEERALIRDTINRLLGTTQLPSEANTVVFNVETLFSIRDAVVLGKPLIDKLVTVAGEINGLQMGEAKVIRVPVGKNIGAIIEQFGGLKDGYGEILLGGPYTGRRGSVQDHLMKMLGGVIVTKPFDQIHGETIGIIQCACGPSVPRLNQISETMGGTIVGHTACKNLVENRGAVKCQNPGNCPGQAEKVLELKKLGAKHILIGHCSDCTNTVMGSAPKLQMEVHHATDHVMKTVGKRYIREFDLDQL